MASTGGPSLGRMVARALLLHCPRCGSRRTFIAGWFKRHDRCRTCGISWRREEGFEIGALALNTIFTFALLAVTMVVGFVATSPDIPVLPFVLALAGVAIVVPIAIYPFTYTVWLAFDLRVHPVDAQEAAAAERAVAGPGPGGSAAPGPDGVPAPGRDGTPAPGLDGIADRRDP